MLRIQTESDIDRLLRGAKALALLSAWNELGLFESLAQGPRLLSDLPANARALEITTPVLKHLGILIGDGERIALSARGRELFENGQFPSGRNFEFIHDISKMADVIKEGGPVNDADGNSKARDGGANEKDPEGTARFLDTLLRRSEKSISQTFQWLSPDLHPGARVLDLGGGHGGYAAAFAEAGHRATLFDFPYVVDYAEKKHGDKLSYIGGNYKDGDAKFGGPYDLIFLSNVVHSESDADSERLVKRLSQCLAPGGSVVIKDMFIDEHGAHPENAVFFGLAMLFYTNAGHTPNLEQVGHWFEKAGLSDLHVINLDTFQLVRGRVPASSGGTPS
jgi:SAM-dependent methyltransferase